MKKKQKQKKFSLGPVFTIMIIILAIIVISSLFSVFQIRGEKTSIVNGYLETSTVTVRNIFSKEGLSYFFSHSIINFSLFEPLFLLIISLIGIGIGEKSGLFKAIFAPFKKIKTSVITVLVLFLSIIATFLGEYSFALLLPLVGVFYKYIGKNPVLGIVTAFIGMTTGYASGLLANYDTVSLGALTQAAARVEVDKNYVFHTFSTLYIMLSSTFILTACGTLFITKFLEPKLPKVKAPIEEELKIDKHALVYSNFTFILILFCLAYAIIPAIPGGGFLLDRTETTYIAQLLSDSAPFKSSIIFIITMILMICSYIYGKVSKNIKSSTDYSVGLSKSFDKLGYVFVLMFFASQMVGILNWTHLGDVVASNLITLLSQAQFSGIPLILSMAAIVLIISFIIPGTTEKWVLASPILVPLFMRANIAPEFTQFIFEAISGVGKALTPIFMYFIVLIALVEKYDTNEKTQTTVFGTIKMVLPTVLMMLGIWILIILGWYIIGLPLGMQGVTTL